MQRMFAAAAQLKRASLTVTVWGALTLAPSLEMLSAQEPSSNAGNGQGASQSGETPRVSARLTFGPPANGTSGNPEVSVEPGTSPAGGTALEKPPAPTITEDPFARLMREVDAAIEGYRSAPQERTASVPRELELPRRDNGDSQPPRLIERPSSLPDVNVWPNVGYEYLGEPIAVERLTSLRSRVRRTLIHYHQRPENTAVYSPWGVMHALIPYGVDTTIIAGRQRANAIAWLCANGSCRGQRLLSARQGKLSVLIGPGYQGHEGQFLAMLAQCYVPADYELTVDGQKFTLLDLIQFEQQTCKPGTELTFKLIAFSHYLPPDATWVGADGEVWDLERLLREELAQQVIGAACGGTHRLMGISYALRYRRLAGLPLDGDYARADKFLLDFHQYAFSLQNPDGSFSTKWLERREARDDDQRRIQTTGHILEWLIYSLPEERLRSPEVVRTVDYLAQLMWNQRNTKWEIGPKGHALHALNLYDQRVFGAGVGQGGPRAEW